MTKKVIQKAARFHSKEERRAIVEEYLSSGCSKQSIWRKYTGEKREHGYLLKWMRQLGYNSRKDSNIVVKKEAMKSENENKIVKVEMDNFEKLQLEKRIEELEKQLKEAEIKAIAFSTMVDIAEREFKIPIRKKLNTKPLKK